MRLSNCHEETEDGKLVYHQYDPDRDDLMVALSVRVCAGGGELTRAIRDEPEAPPGARR